MIDKHIYVHTAVPSPYRRHLFQLIAKAFAKSTFYFHERDVDERPWKYDWSDWGVDARDGVSRRFPTRKKNWSISCSILGILWRSEKDSVHLVWMGAPFWDLILFALYGWITRRIVILWNDGAFKESISNRAKRRYKILSRFCFAGAFTAGKIGADYFKELHFKPCQIANSYFSHDMKAYEKYYENNYEMSRRLVRDQLGIGNKEYALLTISRFLDLKRLVDLAEALKLLERDASSLAKRVHLVLIGDGVCLDHESVIGQLNFVKIHRLSQMPPPEIMSYYCAADLFVFPSEGDIWGLVVNEALSMGLPVICTNSIGAAELVRDGENGFVVPVRNPEKIEKAVIQILSDATLLGKCQKNARTIISTWNSYLGVESLVSLVRRCEE